MVEVDTFRKFLEEEYALPLLDYYLKSRSHLELSWIGGEASADSNISALLNISVMQPGHQPSPSSLFTSSRGGTFGSPMIPVTAFSEILKEFFPSISHHKRHNILKELKLISQKNSILSRQRNIAGSSGETPTDSVAADASDVRRQSANVAAEAVDMHEFLEFILDKERNLNQQFREFSTRLFFRLELDLLHTALDRIDYIAAFRMAFPFASKDEVR